ncbi:ATPase SWSAP1 [Elgaria multicarinata webbii]|uniref:ATPase SWSAP1 n=1 Tax=Elgaria multicarinata webbii TaxID=159646 RepID=UPI002FCD4042
MAALESVLLGGASAGLRPLLLRGPAGSGRSALLFRAALLAAASPARVLFLAPRPLERLPGGVVAGAGAIQRIHFLYPLSFQELLWLVASLHQTLSGSPSLIVLDGLEEYLANCSGPGMAAQLVALLLDTANHFTQKLIQGSAGCQLIVSVKFPGEVGEEAEHLSVIERYFPAQLQLHPDAGESGSFDSRGTAKLIRARLSQLGTEGQEWLMRFDSQGDMRVSPLPLTCEKDGGVTSGNVGGDGHTVVPGPQS